MSVVKLLALDGTTLSVVGLDGTPLIARTYPMRSCR
jgi:hypothetical protein